MVITASNNCGLTLAAASLLGAWTAAVQ